MTKERSDAEFVHQSVEQFEKALVSYAIHLLGDIERARDIVQETFMRLCKADKTKVKEHLAPWLYTVCRNLALDTKRKEARMRHADDSQINRVVSNSPQPSATLETKEDSGRVISLINTLPKNQQEAIWLKFRQGLKYREIAEVMGVTATNVGFLIHKGLNEIRGKMNGLGREA